MRIYKTKAGLQNYLSPFKKNKKIGFVPTMGALHPGHLSLIENAKKYSDIIVASIFVNPTQFDRKEDLEKYPRTIETDLKALREAGCDVVFVPSVKEMYGTHAESEQYDYDGLDQVMEGAHRKGHFAGVGTVVKRLFDIVQPDFAFFGEKDFQQLQLIRKLVEKQQIPVTIVGNPIHREQDGLAMSSRNVRLNESQRKAAPFIYQTLLKAKDFFKNHDSLETIKMVEQEFEKQNVLRLEYFEIADENTLLSDSHQQANKKYRAFIAVFAGEIRLIDNIEFY